MGNPTNCHSLYEGANGLSVPATANMVTTSSAGKMARCRKQWTNAVTAMCALHSRLKPLIFRPSVASDKRSRSLLVVMNVNVPSVLRPVVNNC
jgi:hypothetical protein